MLEVVCIMWFAVEFCLRLAGAPEKWEFLKDKMNIIDVLAILPFLVNALFIEFSGGGGEDFDQIKKVVQIFRIMRILGIFKLARHSKGLNSLISTLTNSAKELGLLVTFIATTKLILVPPLIFSVFNLSVKPKLHHIRTIFSYPFDAHC